MYVILFSKRKVNNNVNVIWLHMQESYSKTSMIQLGMISFSG